jgi:hypothetical protein
VHKASDRPAEVGQRPFSPIPLAAALSLLLCQPVQAAPIEGAGAGIGRTELLVPAVRGQVGEITREIVVEDDIYAQEVIETGPSSAMRIGFRDGTKLSIGPSSRLVIDRYLYDPDVGRGEVALGFLAGIFEFVSGRLAPGSYDLRTPSGHLSIRGTEIIIDTARELIAVPKGRVQLRATDGRSLTVSEGQCLQGRGGAVRLRLGSACNDSLGGYRGMVATLATAPAAAAPVEPVAVPPAPVEPVATPPAPAAPADLTRDEPEPVPTLMAEEPPPAEEVAPPEAKPRTGRSNRDRAERRRGGKNDGGGKGGHGGGRNGKPDKGKGDRPGKGNGGKASQGGWGKSGQDKGMGSAPR